MTTTQDPTFLAAMPAITDLAERLEAEGFSRAETVPSATSKGLAFSLAPKAGGRCLNTRSR